MIKALSESELCLETARLRLTPFSAEDIDIAQQIMCNPAVMRYVADAITPEAAVEHMPNTVKRGAGGRIGMWCATRKDTGQKIGDGVLTPVPIEAGDTDWAQVVPDTYPRDQIEVGYMLVQEAWGQGFATEICARLLRFAFEMTSLSEVVATTDPENAKSQHVLQKCGMRPLGRKRAYGTDDVNWFEMTRADWERQMSGQ